MLSKGLDLFPATLFVTVNDLIEQGSEGRSWRDPGSVSLEMFYLFSEDDGISLDSRVYLGVQLFEAGLVDRVVLVIEGRVVLYQNLFFIQSTLVTARTQSHFGFLDFLHVLSDHFPLLQFEHELG